MIGHPDQSIPVVVIWLSFLNGTAIGVTATARFDTMKEERNELR